MSKPETTDQEQAELLADRAGLSKLLDSREVWIKACTEIIAAAREEGREECRKPTKGHDDADRLGHIRRIFGWRPPEEWDETFLLHQLDKAREEERKAYGYLGRLFLHCAPQCVLLPDLMGLCTQIDNLIVGYRIALGELHLDDTARRAMKQITDKP